MKRFLLVTAALALLVLLFWLVLDRGPTRGAVGASAPPLLPPADAPRAAPALVADSSGRTEVAGTTPLPEETKDAPTAEVARSAPEATRVRGRVLDPEGQGLVGVPIVKTGGMFGTADNEELAVSGAGGRFEIEIVLGKGAYELRCARGSGFATVLAARVTAVDSGRERLLVATPALRLAGKVVETDGPPLTGARVRCEVPLATLAGFPEPLDGTVSVSVDTLSGEGGLFTLAEVPALAGAELTAAAPGYRPSTTAAPVEDRSDLWLELARREPEEPWLQGVVLLADGSPAKGARVQLDSLETKTESDGSFGFEKEWASADAPLVAARAGLQPAVRPGMGAVMSDEFAPPRVRLVLGGPTLSIAGRVVDASGEPCRGWEVSLLDGTEATRNQVPIVLAEDLARGKKVATKSDKQGAFELEGLSARSYVVQAYDREALLMLRSDPVAAGTVDLVLRVPGDALFARLAGVIAGHDGRPIEGARVGIRLVTAASGGALSYQDGASTTTDASGRFELARVPRRHASLGVDGEEVIPQVFELDAADEGQDLRLVVARRCHFRIDLAGGAGPEAALDSFSVLDAGGEALSVYTFQGGGWSSSTWIDLSARGTHPLGVSETAHTLVLFHAGAEVRRLPLALVAGQISVVQLDGLAGR